MKNTQVASPEEVSGEIPETWIGVSEVVTVKPNENCKV